MCFLFFCVFHILINFFLLYLGFIYVYRYKSGSSGWWQAKWAQTTRQACHLGLRYVFSFFSFMFLCILLMTFIIYRPTYVFKTWGGIRLGDDGQNRPKWHVRRVVWALGMSFLCFFVHYWWFLLYTGFIYVLKTWGRFRGQWQAKPTQTMCQHIVWAFGTCFLYVFMHTTDVFIIYRSYPCTEAQGVFGWAMTGKTGPNNASGMLFGQKYVVFFFFVFSIY